MMASSMSRAGVNLDPCCRYAEKDERMENRAIKAYVTEIQTSRLSCLS